jgi:hypothetical protein
VKLRHTPISLPATDVWLDGLLAHAPDVRGLALIPQTSVGNHRDSRDAYVAAALQREGFATLILDLITRYEHNRDPDIRYNIPLLTRRVIAASDWLGHQPPLKRLAVGILGAATGSGAVFGRPQRRRDAWSRWCAAAAGPTTPAPPRSAPCACPCACG